LKTFLKTDYRGVGEFLRDCPELRKAIHLDHTPHFTTLQKVSRKLLRLPVANQLLLHTARSVLKNRTVPLAEEKSRVLTDTKDIERRLVNFPVN
jgi:hypothetical protein